MNTPIIGGFCKSYLFQRLEYGYDAVSGFLVARQDALHNLMTVAEGLGASDVDRVVRRRLLRESFATSSTVRKHS